MYKEAAGIQNVHSYEPIVGRFIMERKRELTELDQTHLDIYDPYAVLEMLLETGELVNRSTYLSKIASGCANSQKGLPDLVIAETNEGIATTIYSLERFRKTNGQQIVIPELEGKRLTKEIDLLIHEQYPSSDNWRYAYETRPWTADGLEFASDSLKLKRVIELTRSNREAYKDDKVKRFSNARSRFGNMFDEQTQLFFGVPSDSLLPLEDDQKYVLPYDMTTLNILGSRVYRFLGGNTQPDSVREKKERHKRIKRQDRRQVYSYSS